MRSVESEDLSSRMFWESQPKHGARDISTI